VVGYLTHVYANSSQNVPLGKPFKIDQYFSKSRAKLGGLLFGL